MRWGGFGGRAYGGGIVEGCRNGKLALLLAVLLLSACAFSLTASAFPEAGNDEICGNGMDDNRNGIVDEGCVEICGNGIDDDVDGLVDEGCKWTDAVVSGKEMYLVAPRESVAGEKIIVSVQHPAIGPCDGIDLLITAPSGKQTSLKTDARGEASFIAAESGNYEVVAYKFSWIKRGEIEVIPQTIFYRRLLMGLPERILGPGMNEMPLVAMILTVMCLAIVSLGYEKAEALFEERVRTGFETAAKNSVRLALSILLASLPLFVNKFSDITVAAGFAGLEILVLLFLIYSAKSIQRPWEIRGA